MYAKLLQVQFLQNYYKCSFYKIITSTQVYTVLWNFISKRKKLTYHFRHTNIITLYQTLKWTFKMPP